mmetsp:Transcript_36103/g.62450  ORF Transcript_36103/g.62450 Transcript_36103/m.62450 type:complete len:709 (+) Transcript_36103:68-2194(+)
MARFLKEHVVAPLLDPSLVGVAMLEKFSKAWHNHKIMTKWIQQLFQHLDRGYVLNSATESLTSCGMKKFLNVAFGDTCERVRAGALDMINRERAGNEIDRNQLKNCVEVFIVMGLCRGSGSKDLKSVDKMLKMNPELDVYIKDFEEPFLKSTKEYYHVEGATWLHSDSVPEYLSRVEAALAEEEMRVSWYLNSATDQKLQRTCVETLLSGPQTELVERPNSGMYALLKLEKGEDLHRMFRLFQLDGVELGVAPMTKVFQQFVEDQGEALLDARRAEIKRLVSEKKKETLSDPTMIMGMLALYKKTNDMVKNLFENHLDFQKAMKVAFQEFMNKEAGKYANVELLTAYCDGVLKGHEAAEKLTEAAMEDRLESVMNLFVYLADKDMFAELYRDALAKRLLNKKTTSMELEKHMISRLKQLQGPPFTTKIEGMIKDHQMCDDNNKQFEEYLAQGDNSASLSELAETPKVQVLTLGFWPSQQPRPVNLPPVLASAQSHFEAFYQEKHAGKKKIQWQFTLGDAEVHGKFPKGTYRLSVSTLQAVALVVLNEQASPLGLDEMSQRIGTDEEVTKRILHSLSCNPKYKVVKKQGQGNPKTINSDDTFAANEKFSSKSKRFTIPMASLDNVGQAIKNKVVEDRSYLIDASVVRTMKARKRMTHHALVSEVANQLQTFNARVGDIKRRIENLIEREYLARREDADGEWTKEYDYLA